MWAGCNGHTEVVQLFLDKGASVGVKDKKGHTPLPAFVTFDEDQLGRMAATLVHRQLLKEKGQGIDPLNATARAVLQLVHLAGFARERARKLRSSDPHSADNHQVLFGRLQLAAAACVQNDESGKARNENVPYWEKDTYKLFRSDDGGKVLEHAVRIEAKELLAQPVVQGYMMLAWGGQFDSPFANHGWRFALRLLLVLLLNLLFILPLVALVPALEPSLADHKLPEFIPEFLTEFIFYLLHLPVVKFGLECAADLWPLPSR